jgi:outer membrane receptor protein involved in Fe transport
VAGVVNIILKKKADGYDINLKAGGSSRGAPATSACSSPAARAWRS